jgi:hypothetical protein
VHIGALRAWRFFVMTVTAGGPAVRLYAVIHLENPSTKKNKPNVQHLTSTGNGSG